MVFRRIIQSIRIWVRYLRRPVYVPEEGRSLVNILELKGPEPFLTEIERLANLGSQWACSLLGYIAISGDRNGTVDTRRARQLVMSAAKGGYAYAQYVLAWTLLIDGDRTGALENMKRAGVQLFPPAALDLALFVWIGVGIERPEPQAAVRLLSHANALDHANTLQLRCVFYRSGKLGVTHRAMGFVLSPYAWIRYAVALAYDPFRAEVLSFSPDGSGAVFRNK